MDMHINDAITLNDKACGLHGHITIYRRNKNTNEVSFWDEGDNVISISGMQTILMKIFNLYLDSYHTTNHSDNRGRDTNLAMPDLNELMGIGVSPTQYTAMESDIAENFFIRGFMVGNGGAAEDSITTKNTNYSFINLRSPIPFQQVASSIDPTIADKYCGVYRSTSSSVKSYYIKKFDALPHIYHSWWVDGQKWNYIDPVTTADLGPNSTNGQPKTNRIETYAECKLSIDESDCKAYFEAAGNTETAMLNELGLVAFDTTLGTRDVLETLYQKIIVEMITLIYDDNRPSDAATRIKSYASTILATFDEAFHETFTVSQPNLNAFYNACSSSIIGESTLDYDALKTEFSKETNIEVNAFYNQSGEYQYETNKFMTYLNDTSDPSIAALTNSEAQRIKLITYYTFNSIPLEDNFEILIDYRIYAN
jgi:hypothetical protein